MQDVCRMPSESRVQLLVDADPALHTTATRGKVGTFHGCGLGNDTAAREEKKEKTEFWDAAEGWLEEELVKDIFCDALDHFFCEGTDSIEIQGKWQRDLLDEKSLREKKEDEEEDSFSQDSRASTTRLQDIEEEFFFDALDTIDKEEEKNDDDDVFWDASDKKGKEWQEIVRIGYRQRGSEKKAPNFFLYRRRKEQEGASRRRRCS